MFFMKARFLFCGLITLSFLANVEASAQAPRPRPGRAVPKPRVTAVPNAGRKDGLTMQQGRVILTELGTSNPLTADKKLVNGTVITAAGLVTTPDGTTTQMKEGDLVSLTGRVTSHASIAEADSLAKLKLFDALHPGKRKKMEEEAERKAKAKAKAEEKRTKIKERR